MNEVPPTHEGIYPNKHYFFDLGHCWTEGGTKDSGKRIGSYFMAEKEKYRLIIEQYLNRVAVLLYNPTTKFPF